LPSHRTTEKELHIGGGEETSIDHRQVVLLSKFSIADSQLIPSRLSPAKGGSAKTIPNQTASIIVKRELDADILLKTPICVAAKS
jgi:hypothetical protein